MHKWLRWTVVLVLVVLVGPALPHAHFTAPAPTALLRDQHGQYLGQVGSDGDAPLGYWPVDGVPPQRVVAAIVAIEDRRFWHHPGVDPIAVIRAVRQNLRSGRRISGASTLAMQVARLQRPGPRNWRRKITEAVTAVLLTARYGRRGILRQYLRLVPYGNRVRGIGYAARRYLDKPVGDLSWAEIAFLSAIPQSPSHTNPYTSEGRARARLRGERILALLHEDGVISDAQWQQARQELDGIGAPRSDVRPPVALHATLALADLVATQPQQAMVVQATLDTELQTQVVEDLQEGLAVWRQKGAGNGAVMVVELPSLAVRAAVGSADFFDHQWSGSIDYTNTPRYPGSTLKPLLYARALDVGVISPTSILDDVQRGPSGVSNADERFLGPLVVRRALAGSRNVPAVNLLARLGLDAGHDFFRELGLHHDEQTAAHWGLGMAIGGFPLTMRQLATAYGALATDGRLRPLRWLVDQPLERGVRVFSPHVVWQVEHMLSDPLARMPSFPRMGFGEFPFPVAIKTGTSSGFRDAWAVAWSEKWLVVVWVGHPDFRPMNRLSGYRVGANLANTVMMNLHSDQRDGLSDVGRVAPAELQPHEICGLSGQRARAHCSPVSTEWLTEQQRPSEDCTVHQRRLIDRRSGNLADASTPPAESEAVVFIDLPARYAEWAAQQRLRTPQQPAARTDAGEQHRLQIRSPENGAVLYVDPEAPQGRSTLALMAVVDPPTDALLWLHNGQPLELVSQPYTLRWPLQSGAHQFQVMLPQTGEVSETVAVIVR